MACRFQPPTTFTRSNVHKTYVSSANTRASRPHRGNGQADSRPRLLGCIRLGTRVEVFCYDTFSPKFLLPDVITPWWRAPRSNLPWRRARSSCGAGTGNSFFNPALRAFQSARRENLCSFRPRNPRRHRKSRAPIGRRNSDFQQIGELIDGTRIRHSALPLRIFDG